MQGVSDRLCQSSLPPGSTTRWHWTAARGRSWLGSDARAWPLPCRATEAACQVRSPPRNRCPMAVRVLAGFTGFKAPCLRFPSGTVWANARVETAEYFSLTEAPARACVRLTFRTVSCTAGCNLRRRLLTCTRPRKDCLAIHFCNRSQHPGGPCKNVHREASVQSVTPRPISIGT